MKKEYVAFTAGIVLGLISTHFLLRHNSTAPEPYAEEFNARYKNGTPALARAPVVVRITKDEVILVQPERSFSVAIANITCLAYSDSKAKRYFVAFQWRGLSSGEVVLAIERQDYNRVVGVLTKAFERVQVASPA